ncbi:Oligosaccaryltransferase [Cordyceps militaris CM01]|uniref:Dolichyl-diphosphooligosaccharide--protein glycosyltransferase subunit 4 n=1 Tax=Cordyceps militaris (strain CM01) TaxID=983644 RepID=G3JRE6_CORMM|nr:Oligosaccaryltransferase [Cordyceps militaris CM01]EGX88496.1 Oligosaccaryltransferase [Cordyceps militaris CM01]
MISDNDLYTLAIFLGSAAMLLIILYHFLESGAAKTIREETNTLYISRATLGKAIINDSVGVLEQKTHARPHYTKI